MRVTCGVETYYSDVIKKRTYTYAFIWARYGTKKKDSRIKNEIKIEKDDTTVCIQTTYYTHTHNYKYSPRFIYLYIYIFFF